MVPPAAATDDPFVDPIASFEEATRDHPLAADSTLAVGKSASLTLGTDSLIVLGQLPIDSGELTTNSQ